MLAQCACCTRYGLSLWRWRAPGNSIRGRINLETVTPLPITEPRLLGRLCRLGRYSQSAVIGDTPVVAPTLVARSASDAKARTGIVVVLLRQQMLATSECAVRSPVDLKSNTMRLPSSRACSPQSQWLISSVTRAMPLNPRACAPAGVRSIIRPRTNGPRSFILTTTNLPLPTFVTRTFVPKGRVRCAAVKASDRTRSPFAVFGPLLAE